jgi:hypothetical protein
VNGLARKVCEAEMGVRLPPRPIDIAVVTALPEELEPVLGLLGGREQWQQFTIDKFLHYYGIFKFGQVEFAET